MDDDGVPLLLLTLSAIDSVGMTVGCLRMDVGDVTINRVVKPYQQVFLRCRRSQIAPLEVRRPAPLEVCQSAPLEASLENGFGVVFDFRGGAHR